MIIQCDNCKTKFKLNESAIKGAGVKVRCTKCESVFVVTRPDVEQALVFEQIEAAASDTPSETPAEPPFEDKAPDDEPPVDETGWGLGSDTAEEDKTPEEEGPSSDVGSSEEPPAGDEEGWGLGLESSPDETETMEEVAADTPSEEITFDEPVEQEAPGEVVDEEGLPSEEITFGESGEQEAPGETETTEEAAADTPSEEITFEEPGEEDAEDISEDIDWSLGEEGDEGDKGDKGEEEGDKEDVDWGLDEDEAGSVEDYTARLEKELGIDTEDNAPDEKPSGAGVEEGANDVEAEASPALEGPLDETVKGDEDKEIPEEEATPPSVETEAGAPKEEEAGGEIETAEEPAKKGGRRGVMIAIFIIIIGIGGLYFSGVFQSLLGSSKPVQRTLEIKDLRGTFVQNEDIGRIYAVEGRIENISDESQEVLGVKITIFDKAGKSLASKTVSLARLVSSEELRSLSGEEIDRHYRDLSKGSIPPHGITPLMAIFSKLPKGMDELVVEVVR